MPVPVEQDSNLVGLTYAEELTLKTLPGTPVWWPLEPDSFGDFGATIKRTARAFINASRQKKKGSITGIDSAVNFQSDLTPTNLLRLMQGFFFANAREKVSTNALNGTQIPLTTITSATTFNAASGLSIFTVGRLVKPSGCSSANNALISKVVSSTATTVVTNGVYSNETLTSSAQLDVVGFEFPTADVQIVVSGTSSIALQAATTDLTTLGLIPGEWVFIGGDATINKFVNNVGFARIESISSTLIKFNSTTFTAISEAGTGLTIRLFYGTVIRNEKIPSLIVQKSYQFERTLGNDSVGVQSEYVLGAVPNEIKITVPLEDKVSCDLGFVGMTSETRTGTQGVKSGTRPSMVSEVEINTSSDIYRMRVAIVDPLTLNNASLFGYVTNADITIGNGVSGNKAIGVIGSFSANAGDFDVKATINAYFSDVAAIQAVKANASVEFNLISACRNTGLVFDIPLMGIDGSKINVEKDKSIMVPLDGMAAECPLGYTCLVTSFKYLPSIAMPNVTY